LAERPGENACRPSSRNAAAIRTPPTRNGRGQPKQTSNVIAKYPIKWPVCQPSSVRGVQLAGPRAPMTRRTTIATLQTFAPALSDRPSRQYFLACSQKLIVAWGDAMAQSATHLR
jgi:hypothetical protein